MSRKSALLIAGLMAVALVGSPAARADYFYSFQPIDNPTVLSDHSGMGIIVNNQTQVGPISTGLNSNVVAATLSTFINPGVTGTDTFNTGQESTVKLTIVDGTQNDTVNFGLKFSGSLSASNSQIGVAFDNGQSTETKTLTVNGHQYTITLDKLVPPGVPGAPPGTVGGAQGSIPGSVGGQILAGIQVGGGTSGDTGGDTSGGTTAGGTTAGGTGGTTGGTTGGGGTGGPNNAPEPSTMVLSALGAALFGFGGWRRWLRRS
jgi:hypothetical protein